MRTPILIGIVLLCSASQSFANESVGPQCIRLTPESRGFDFTLPKPPPDQAQAAAGVYCLARVEGTQDRGETVGDDDVKRVFIFRNTEGAYVVRILDLPPGQGLRGRF
jgi:hypothetical protein